jgi:hypothetical protein
LTFKSPGLIEWNHGSSNSRHSSAQDPGGLATDDLATSVSTGASPSGRLGQKQTSQETLGRAGSSAVFSSPQTLKKANLFVKDSNKLNI